MSVMSDVIELSVMADADGDGTYFLICTNSSRGMWVGFMRSYWRGSEGGCGSSFFNLQRYNLRNLLPTT